MNLKSLTYFAASLFVILPPLSSAQTADIEVVGNLVPQSLSERLAAKTQLFVSCQVFVTAPPLG